MAETMQSLDQLGTGSRRRPKPRNMQKLDKQAAPMPPAAQERVARLDWARPGQIVVNTRPVEVFSRGRCCAC
jgi:hypothetical protein